MYFNLFLCITYQALNFFFHSIFFPFELEQPGQNFLSHDLALETGPLLALTAGGLTLRNQ